jgi:hypothetical protein
MRKDTGLLSEVALFVAGVLAAGLVTGTRKARSAPSSPADSSSVSELRDAVSALESRVAGQEAAASARLGQIESRLDDHSARLAEVPSTDQIVGAMEQLLAKTMTSLDERLTAQAHSIEVLKTTVSQTDSLLERVLESLDSLQTFADPAADPDLLQRAG